jgi:isoleucyl-tRNA synthetase
MDAVLDLVAQAHTARKNGGIKVRQPLSEMRVVTSGARLACQMQPFEPLILEELNIKQIKFVESAPELYTISARLEPKTGKPKYGRLFAKLQESLAALAGSEVAAKLAAGTGLRLRVADQKIEISPAEVLIEKKGVAPWALAEGGGFLVLVNAHLTDELIREGQVRDLVREIQNLRKELDLKVTDRIEISYVAGERIATAINIHGDFLREETLAVSIDRGSHPAANAHVVKIGDENIQVSISKAEPH